MASVSFISETKSICLAVMIIMDKSVKHRASQERTKTSEKPC